MDFLDCLYKYDADIYMFSETWLSDSEQLNLDIQGYTCDHINGNKSTGAEKIVEKINVEYYGLKLRVSFLCSRKTCMSVTCIFHR